MATDLTLSTTPRSLPRAVKALDLQRQAAAAKTPVRVATTANMGTLTGEQTVDGVALKVGDRYLRKDQTAPAENGIFIVRHTAHLRAEDADHPGKLLAGTKVTAQEGTTNAGTTWRLTTTGTIVLGTTSLTWTADGGGGSGTVTSVTGTSPVQVATGTTTPVVSVDAATSTASGIVELATNAEVATGTDTARAVTPAGAAATYATITNAATKAATTDLVDAAGDLLVGSADNTLARLAKGTALQVLRTNAGATALEWATAASGSVATDAIWDAAGDLAVGSGADTAARLAKGTAFQVLRTNSAATALEWATPNLSVKRPKTGATVYPGWPGAATMSHAASTPLGNGTDRFIPFEVRRPITITDVSCSTTTTAVGKFAWVGIVALNDDLQPSAAVLQQSTVALDATGTHTWNPTTLTLDAGHYAVCWNHDSTATFRFWYFGVTGMAWNDGNYTNNVVASLEKTRAAAAFSGTPTWDSIVASAMSTTALSIYSAWMMKWTPS